MVQLPFKVFNVSPQRSGTKSFHAFCQAHGLRSAHWPGSEIDGRAEKPLQTIDSNALWASLGDYYGQSDIFSDFPTSLIYRQAYRDVPNARFVLITRDVGDWVRSVRTLTYDRDLSWLERFFYHENARPTFGGRGLEPYTDDELACAYRRFCARATGFLTIRRQPHFLQASLEDPDLAEKIAAFIGFKVEHKMEHI